MNGLFSREMIERFNPFYLRNPNNDKNIEMINEKLGINSELKQKAYDIATKLFHEFDNTDLSPVERGVLKFKKSQQVTLTNISFKFDATIMYYMNEEIYEEKINNYYIVPNYDMSTKTVSIVHHTYPKHRFYNDFVEAIMHEFEHALFMEHPTYKPTHETTTLQQNADDIIHYRVKVKKIPESIMNIAYSVYYTIDDEICAHSNDSYAYLSKYKNDIENHYKETSLYKNLENLEIMLDDMEGYSNTKKESVGKWFGVRFYEIKRKIKWGIKRYRQELCKIAALVHEEYLNNIRY